MEAKIKTNQHQLQERRPSDQEMNKSQTQVHDQEQVKRWAGVLGKGREHLRLNKVVAYVNKSQCPPQIKNNNRFPLDCDYNSVSAQANP